MLNIEIDASEVFSGLMKLDAVLKPAVAAGMTRTMRAVEQAELNAMENQIDRPTPFTMNSLWVQEARPNHLDTTLGIRKIASQYLQRPILGGDVNNTLVPVMPNIKLNQYGNIIAKRKGIKALAKREKEGFVATIKGRLGVYRRVNGKRDEIEAVIFKDPNAPRTKRFQFYETGEEVIQRRVMQDIEQAIRAAVSQS